MRVLGLDLSYTSSGIVVLEEGKVLLDIAVKAGDPKQVFKTRMDILWAGIERALALNPELVAIEGAAYDKVFKAFDLGQLNGVVKYRLAAAGYHYIEIPPTSARKIVVDKGNASKEETASLIEAKFGYKNNVNDVVDAYVIAQAATIGFIPKVKEKKSFRKTGKNFKTGSINLIV